MSETDSDISDQWKKTFCFSSDDSDEENEIILLRDAETCFTRTDTDKRSSCTPAVGPKLERSSELDHTFVKVGEFQVSGGACEHAGMEEVCIDVRANEFSSWVLEEDSKTMIGCHSESSHSKNGVRTGRFRLIKLTLCSIFASGDATDLCPSQGHISSSSLTSCDLKSLSPPLRSAQRSSKVSFPPSAAHHRFVGGVLQHPFVRLTGQCTKLFSGPAVKEFPSARGSESARWRSSLGKSVRSLIRTPSISGVVTPQNNFRLPKRMPKTQYSTRGRIRLQAESSSYGSWLASGGSPAHSPGSNIRGLFLTGDSDGKIVDQNYRKDRRRRSTGHVSLSFGKKQISLFERDGRPLSLDCKMQPRLRSDNRRGDVRGNGNGQRSSPVQTLPKRGVVLPTVQRVQPDAQGSDRTGMVDHRPTHPASPPGSKTRVFGGGLGKGFKFEGGGSPQAKAARSPSTHSQPEPDDQGSYKISPTHSPRVSKIRAMFSAGIAKLDGLNLGIIKSPQVKAVTPPLAPPILEAEEAGGSGRGTRGAVAGSHHFLGWPMNLFGRQESQVESEPDDPNDGQIWNSFRRPPDVKKNILPGLVQRSASTVLQNAMSGRRTSTQSEGSGITTTTGKADTEEIKEDGIAEMALRSRANMDFYIRMGALLILVIPDVVTFLIFQVAWGKPVFLCRNEPVLVVEKQTWHAELDGVNVGALLTILALHVWFLISKVRDKGMEGRSGFRAFLSRKVQRGWGNVAWNAVYLVVVLVSIGVLAADITECVSYDGDSPKAERIRRVHLMVHMLRCICILKLLRQYSGTLRTRLQSMVSMNKRRFAAKDPKLDLDLTYICDRVIAMALPCVRDVLYRNEMGQVARFFSSRHYGRFAVTNLCNSFEEGGNGNYDPALLYHQVQRLPMHDHNAPFMQTLVSFLEGAVDFLNQSKANVVAVHCRGGKGRTGTFCSALMLWVGCCQSAEEAMQLYANRRTRPSSRACVMQGVDAPCQKRCIKYLERMIYENVDILASSPLLLTKIKLSGMTQGWRNLCVVVEEKGKIVYDSGKAFGALQSTGGVSGFDLEISFDPVLLRGDVTIRVFLVNGESRMIGCNGHVSLAGSRLRYQPSGANESAAVKGRQLAFVSFHTAFHDNDISFTKAEVDGAYNDHESRFFSPNFSVTLAVFRGSSWQDLLPSSQAADPEAMSYFPVGGRLPPAMDAMRMEQELDSLMQRLSPEEEEFGQGDVVFDSRCCEAGQLCYVVSGQVSYESVVPKSDRAYGCLGITNCPVMGTVGSGAMLGMVEFVLGRGGSPFGTVYAAKTDKVTIRRFTLQSDSHGPMIPALMPAVSPNDLDLIFKKSAQALSDWSANLSCQVKYATEMNNVKREYTVGMEVSEKSKLVQQIMEKYQIPVTERVLVLCEACMEKQGLLENNVVRGIRVQGTLLLFQRWLVFVPLSGQTDHEMLSTVKAIAHTKLEKDKLVISFSSQASDARRQSEIPDSQLQMGAAGARRLLLSQSLRLSQDTSFPQTAKARSFASSTGPGHLMKRSMSKLLTHLSPRIGPHSPGASESRTPQIGPNPASRNTSPDPEPTGFSAGQTFLDGHSSHDRNTLWQRQESSFSKSTAWVPSWAAIASDRASFRGKARTRSVHEESIDIDSDRTFVFTDGMETAIKVEAEIEKQLQLQSQEPAAPLLLLGGASELTDIARMFSLLLPEETLSGEDMQALQQLLSPFRRKRYRAGAQIFAEGELNQVIFFVLAGTVSIRAGNAVLVTMQVGEVVGERSFWGQGNRGRSAKMIAETDVEVQWLEFESIEIVCSGRPLVAARVARCLSMCIAKRIQRQLQQLQQVEMSICSTQDAL